MMDRDRELTKAGPLWVRDTGDGAPLLLLHGILATGGVFDHLASRLLGRFRLLTPTIALPKTSRLKIGAMSVSGMQGPPKWSKSRPHGHLGVERLAGEVRTVTVSVLR